MTSSQHDPKLAQVVRRIDPHARLLRAWPLAGGVSAQVTALEIERGGQRQKMVVRQHGAADLAANPRIAADEFRLLGLLQSAGVAAPAPLHLDTSGAVFPTPYLVTAFVEGTADFAPASLDDALARLAAHLASVHRVDRVRFDLSFLPALEARLAAALRAPPAALDEALDEGRIRAALAAAWPFPRANEAVLLHGDFWPGNVLWRGGQPAALLDWEDAALGDPLADLGCARLEMLWAFGGDAMQAFTAHYQAYMPGLDMTGLPCWDLWAALRPAGRLAGWGLDAAAEARMRAQHRAFVASACQRAS